MLSSVVITDPARLRALRSSWSELLERSSVSDASLDPAWMLSWWDVFGGDEARELRSLALYDGPRLVGLAPLLARRHTYGRAVPFRRLELLASGERQSEETCSDYLGIVAERGREADVVASFVDALTGDGLGPWDELILSSMDGNGPLPELLERELRARGAVVTRETWSSSPYITLPRTWDEYLGALKPTKRAQLRKSLRAFESWAGGEPEIVRVRSQRELPEGKRILMALHRERWGGDGVFGSPRFCAFHDRLMEELLPMGALDLGWMNVRGEPVAAFYNFRWNGKVSFYQSGRKLDLPDAIRVGVTMHGYLIRSAIEEGLREYDFLAGASQYKMALALATRPLVRLRAARPSLRERARDAGERAARGARRIRDWARDDVSPRAPARIRPVLDRLLGASPIEPSASNGAPREGVSDARSDAAGSRARRPR